MRPAPLVFFALAVASAACGSTVGSTGPVRSPMAAQWLDRAKVSYRSGDFDDARDSARHALGVAPNDLEIRELAARIALVRLDYDEALRLTEGLESSDGHGIRGRAYWFTGDLEHAADELEAMLADPKVKDPWARDVAGLARRGSGRHPFQMEGGTVASIEMPRQLDRVPLGAFNVVPCELDGERILALVATGSSEVLLDSNSRHEAAWVDMRFDRVEIKDVPALAQDLSAIGRQLGVPIKALIGAQLLRHAHVTFDRRGDQFIVRRQDATTPPEASRVPLYYLRGGGMVLRATVTAKDDPPIPLLVDSSRPFPLFLQDAAWKKAGVDLQTLVPLPETPTVRRGLVPVLRVGGFDLSGMPAIEGGDFADLANGLDVDLGGVVGADLLSFFRVTFADGGRFMSMSRTRRSSDPTSRRLPPRARRPPPRSKPRPHRSHPPATDEPPRHRPSRRLRR